MASYDSPKTSDLATSATSTSVVTAQDETLQQNNFDTSFEFPALDGSGSIDDFNFFFAAEELKELGTPLSPTFGNLPDSSSDNGPLDTTNLDILDTGLSSGYGTPQYLQPADTGRSSGYSTPQILKPASTTSNVPTKAPHKHLCWHEQIGWYHMSPPSRLGHCKHHIVGYYEPAMPPLKFFPVSSAAELSTDYMYPDPAEALAAPSPYPGIPVTPPHTGNVLPPQPTLTVNTAQGAVSRKRRSSSVASSPVKRSKRVHYHKDDLKCAHNCQARTCTQQGGPKNDLHVKRPRNAFILYKSKCGKPPTDAAEAWCNEPERVKAHYQAMATTEKREHAKKYPGYKYTPIRGNSKCTCGAEKKRRHAGLLSKASKYEQEADELDLDDYAHPAVKQRKAPVAQMTLPETSPTRRSQRLQAKSSGSPTSINLDSNDWDDFDADLEV